MLEMLNALQKKLGLRNDEITYPNIDRAVAEGRITKQEASILLNSGVGSQKPIPDMPFKTTWPELVMKRMIAKAVANGKSRISWTPGEAQAARYDLSKHLDKLHYDTQTSQLIGSKDGRNILNKTVKKEDLPDVVGKDVAEKLLNSTKKLNGYNELSGLGIKVGGEGMKGFYDQMLPKMVEKLGKPYGVKVKEGDTAPIVKNVGDLTPDQKAEYDRVEKPARDEYNRVVKQARDESNRVEKPALDEYNRARKPARDEYNRVVKQARDEYDRIVKPARDEYNRVVKQARDEYERIEKQARTFPQKVHYFDIPEKMKQDVLKKGFPLFSDTSASAPLSALEHSPESHAERSFYSKLQQTPNVEFYHESPGDVSESMSKNGIKGTYGTFATIGKPSNFVTTPVKTIVKFVVPKSELNHISPDMRYDGYRDLMEQHPNLIGSDVGFGRNIPPSWIKDIQVVNNKQNVEGPIQQQEKARARGGKVVASEINHNPTEAQKHANNYKKDHINIHGLQITIENAKGSKRSGVGKDGHKWTATIFGHYGYVIGHPKGADGDHVDVYVGPHVKSKHVFVINQIDADTKRFDEIKSFLGYATVQQALNVYLKGFSDNKGLDRIGSIIETDIDTFKHWLKTGDTTKPFKPIVEKS